MHRAVKVGVTMAVRDNPGSRELQKICEIFSENLVAFWYCSFAKAEHDDDDPRCKNELFLFDFWTSGILFSFPFHMQKCDILWFYKPSAVAAVHFFAGMNILLLKLVKR